MPRPARHSMDLVLATVKEPAASRAPRKASDWFRPGEEPGNPSEVPPAPFRKTPATLGLALSAPGVLTTALREPPRSLVHTIGHQLRETARYRALVRYLVSTSLRTESARTVFGYFWWLLDPLLLMAAYVVLVDVIFQRGEENFPIFVLTALVSWKYFMSGTRTAITGTIGKERLMRQVAFPKSVLPLASVLAEAIHFAAGIVVVILAAIPFGITPHPVLALVVIVALVQLVFTLGVAFLLSALNVFFRDIQFLTTHLFRVWFYLSPGLYALSAVPERFQDLYVLNPFATFFPAYQELIMEGTLPDLSALGILAAASAAVLALGYAVFVRLEPSFTKVS
jgi:lipopolysaccharide transport system permease protein